MSLRLSTESTKYGPSVNSGRTIQEGSVAAPATAGVSVAVIISVVTGAVAAAGVAIFAAPPVSGVAALSFRGPQPAIRAALAPPSSFNTSRRDRTLPTCSSSFIIIYLSSLSYLYQSQSYLRIVWK
jgi:hypothetical protein